MQVQQVETRDEYIQELQRQIAELKTENILLQEQLTNKEQFTAMIAHDLRSPLTPIINYAKLIIRQQGAKASPTLLRNTNIIVGQAQRMARLVGDLLDMSRLTTGQFTLLRDQCDLTALVTEMVEQLRPVAPRHTFAIDVPAGPLVGNYDSERLQQAIGNLLDNAIKYSDEETTITLRVWTTANTVHVSVHNRGRDIPADEIDQIFLPFVRLRAASSRKGSGLGLFISKSIIQAHGGDLRLEPYVTAVDANAEKHSTGTTFSFTLPFEA